MKSFILSLGVWCGVAVCGAAETVPPAPSAPSYNEFQGSMVAVDSDRQLLQMAVDGGYRVEFSFDIRTLVKDGSQTLKVSDLSYGDKITARYIGKELYAKEIIRSSAAPSQPVVPLDPLPPTDPIPPTQSNVVSSVTVSTPAP